MIDLYRKNIWNDAKTVNIISQACFSDVAKISATALKFFLNLDQEKEEEEDADLPDVSSLQHTLSCNKKTKARKAQLEKALSTIRKVYTFKFDKMYLNLIRKKRKKPFRRVLMHFI